MLKKKVSYLLMGSALVLGLGLTPTNANSQAASTTETVAIDAATAAPVAGAVAAPAAAGTYGPPDPMLNRGPVTPDAGTIETTVGCSATFAKGARTIMCPDFGANFGFDKGFAINFDIPFISNMSTNDDGSRSTGRGVSPFSFGVQKMVYSNPDNSNAAAVSAQYATCIPGTHGQAKGICDGKVLQFLGSGQLDLKGNTLLITTLGWSHDFSHQSPDAVNGGVGVTKQWGNVVGALEAWAQLGTKDTAHNRAIYINASGTYVIDDKTSVSFNLGRTVVQSVGEKPNTIIGVVYKKVWGTTGWVKKMLFFGLPPKDEDLNPNKDETAPSSAVLTEQGIQHVNSGNVK